MHLKKGNLIPAHFVTNERLSASSNSRNMIELQDFKAGLKLECQDTGKPGILR